MQSWIFRIITPVFSVTWSFRNHSNMLIWYSNISYKCWKQLCWLVFLWTLRNISFCRFLINKTRSIEQHLFEIEIIYNIINVSLSILINLMHPCWIKVFIIISSFKNKNLTDPKKQQKWIPLDTVDGFINNINRRKVNWKNWKCKRDRRTKRWRCLIKFAFYIYMKRLTNPLLLKIAYISAQAKTVTQIL